MGRGELSSRTTPENAAGDSMSGRRIGLLARLVNYGFDHPGRTLLVGAALIAASVGAALTIPFTAAVGLASALMLDAAGTGAIILGGLGAAGKFVKLAFGISPEGRDEVSTDQK